MALSNVVPLTPPLPQSAARRKVAEAARLLQEGLNALYQEEREKADARARANAETDAKAKRLVALAQARQATRGLRLEVDKKWFWSFNNEMLDLLRQVAADAKSRGEHADARAIEAHIDAACEQLEKIQKRETAK
jgi:hypothetical protein